MSYNWIDSEESQSPQYSNQFPNVSFGKISSFQKTFPYLPYLVDAPFNRCGKPRRGFLYLPVTSGDSVQTTVTFIRTLSMLLSWNSRFSYSSLSIRNVNSQGSLEYLLSALTSYFNAYFILHSL